MGTTGHASCRSDACVAKHGDFGSCFRTPYSGLASQALLYSRSILKNTHVGSNPRKSSRELLPDQSCFLLRDCAGHSVSSPSCRPRIQQAQGLCSIRQFAARRWLVCLLITPSAGLPAARVFAFGAPTFVPFALVVWLPLAGRLMHVRLAAARWPFPRKWLACCAILLASSFWGNLRQKCVRNISTGCCKWERVGWSVGGRAAGLAVERDPAQLGARDAGFCVIRARHLRAR